MVGVLLNYLGARFCKPLMIVSLILSSIVSSSAANYIIDPANTNVRFAIDNFKTSSTTGGFYNVKGQLQYNPIAKTGNISLVIPINSLDTGNKSFNLKLTSPNFFDVGRFPSARFESTKWHFNNKVNSKVTRVDGNLTLHGETHPVTLKATTFNCSSNTTDEKEICNGGFTTTIDRTKWNINKYTLFGISKNLTINIQVAATKQ